MSRHKTFPHIEPLSAELTEKGMLNLYWNGKLFTSISVAQCAIIASQREESPETIASDGVLGAQQFAEAYAKVRTKYSGFYPPIKPESKYWQHMVKGAKDCAEMKMDPIEWCEVLVGRYTEMKGGLQTVVPQPSQTHGDFARVVMSDWRAKNTVNPNVAAIRRARLAVGVPLGEDHEYQRIRTRMKKRIHTTEDVAYMRTRQIEIYGVEKPWLKEIEALAKDKQTKEDK